MKEVRWGIIGVGDVTEKKSGPGFQKAERSELVAVMRRSANKAKDYAERHGVPKWYDDADELIHDSKVDAVYIATPPDSHHDYTRRAASAGKPIYVEKPMARTAAECEAMLSACKDAGVPLFVAYYRRAMPRFVKIKELLDSGAVGKVRAVEVRLQRSASPSDVGDVPWRVRPEISGGGYFVDMGSHTLDFLDWMLGPIAQVTGSAANQAGRYPAEDVVSAAFEFESGVQGTGLWCFSGAQEVDEVNLIGSKGSLRFASFDGNPLRLTTDNGEEVIHAPYPETVQQPLIQEVVDALTGQGECSSIGESALRTAKVVDTLLEAYRKANAITFEQRA